MNYVLEPHVPFFTKLRCWSFWRCRYCGLVRLNNPATQLAWKLGCNYHEHPRIKGRT